MNSASQRSNHEVWSLVGRRSASVGNVEWRGVAQQPLSLWAHRQTVRPFCHGGDATAIRSQKNHFTVACRSQQGDHGDRCRWRSATTNWRLEQERTAKWFFSWSNRSRVASVGGCDSDWTRWQRSYVYWVVQVVAPGNCVIHTAQLATHGRTGWAGHAARTADTRNVQNFVVVKPLEILRLKDRVEGGNMTLTWT
jgi:hypothetical protein